MLTVPPNGCYYNLTGTTQAQKGRYKEMKKTYTRTMMIADLTSATFKIDVYQNNKYMVLPTEETTVTVNYTGVKSWDFIAGEDAEEIEAETDGSGVDEMHEYLVIHFVDGTTSTFRNSYVDMFIL